jgi:hypothetical protein
VQIKDNRKMSTTKKTEKTDWKYHIASLKYIRYSSTQQRFILNTPGAKPEHTVWATLDEALDAQRVINARHKEVTGLLPWEARRERRDAAARLELARQRDITIEEIN